MPYDVHMYVGCGAQCLRMVAWSKIKALGIPFGQLAQIVLLLIIYSAFCDMFSGLEGDDACTTHYPIDDFGVHR